MTISKKIQDAFNKQINEELHSAYIYLAMAAHFDEKNLKGMGQWMKTQAKEEVGHAMRFFTHIVDRNGTVALDAVEKPRAGWKNAADIFEAALRHEQYITGKIHALVTIAEAEKDRAAWQMLQWFVQEQIEEEATADENATKAKMVKDDPAGLLALDKALGKRASKE